MNKLKRYFLELNNKKLKKQGNLATRYNVNYDKANTVGILFSTEHLENIESLTNFIRGLEQDGKQVKALTYHDNESKTLKTLNFKHHTITEKDISIFGNINSFLADDFVKTDFDYLFCINIQPSEVFNNILLRSKAKFRIGKFLEGDGNYELMIKINDNEGTDALIKQMDHYVKTIKND